LKFRFIDCEKKNFSFKGLKKASEKLKAHKVVSETLRKEIDCKLKDNLEMRVAC
jgi:hypothetical protein